MDIENAWKKIETGSFGENSQALKEALKSKSLHPITRLIRNIKVKIIWSMVFGGIFLLFIPVSDYLLSTLLMGFMVLLYLTAIILWKIELKRLEEIIETNKPLLVTMKICYTRITHAIKLEEKVALFIYPISATAGFFFGFFLVKNPTLLFSSQQHIGIWVLCMIIISPLAHLATKRLNARAYGRYLKELKSKIDLLESSE
jgi:uncharacterized membrane protein